MSKNDVPKRRRLFDLLFQTRLVIQAVFLAEVHLETIRHRDISQREIRRGQTVCDVGCGNGFYTLEMAKLVGPQGRVLAVDIQPEMLRLLKERAADAGLNNIEPILGSPINPRLPEGEVDLILLVDVYHEFGYPEQMLRAMRESLKPKGRVALAEFRMEDPSVPIKLPHKMSKEQILKEFLPNGYRLVREYDELPWQHLMFFERDGAAGD